MSIGIVLVSITAYLIYSNQKFEVRAQPVKGKVMDYRSHISSHDNGSTMLYSPVFSYEVNGKTFTYFSTTSSSDKDYTVGEVIEILVDPDDPENVLVNSFMEKWFLSVLLDSEPTLEFNDFKYLFRMTEGTTFEVDRLDKKCQ